MKSPWFTRISFIFFVISHLALIPILSLFGINVCHILEGHGFLFGCNHAARFAISVLIGQTAVLGFTFWLLKSYGQVIFRFQSITHLVPILILGLHFLNFYWNGQIYEAALAEVSPYSTDVHIFLWVCMTMILVISWQWIETEVTFLSRKFQIKEYLQPQSLFGLWLTEQKNRVIPVVGLILFFGSYFSLMFIRQENWDNPDEILAEQKEQFLFLTVGVVIWQLIVYYFDFYRNLILSKEIEAHLRSIQRQNFKYKSNVSQSGFLGVIFNLLNQLSETLVKKSRLLKGFSTFVSESVANDVLNESTQHYVGDNKQVAILMADIRDFTSFSSHIKPQEVVDLLNIYFSDMIEVFVENGITVDKFIGDGILAYAVVEDGNEKAVYEAMLKTAFDMHAKLHQTNAKLKQKRLPKIQLGVGLHEGRVVLGSIGSKDKLQYTIIGDPVNVTARLEGFCKEKQVGIVISSHFYSRIQTKNHSKFSTLGKQAIRGIDIPMEIYGALPYAQKKQNSAA